MLRKVNSEKEKRGTMKVNGQQTELKQELTLKDFLLENGYDLTKIAVERNSDIVPKAQYGQVILNPEDVLEIVRFVGGG